VLISILACRMPVLQIVVNDFEKEYGNDWWSLKREVDRKAQIAKVHLVMNDEEYTVLERGALFGCSLWSCSMPYVTKIYKDSFRSCKNLWEVNLPDCITIEAAAFVGCYNLARIALPKARLIGRDAFYACRKLRYVTLDPDVEVKIRNSAFQSCPSLRVLAVSTNFNTTRPDPTNGIASFLRWRNDNDRQRDVWITYTQMFALSNWHYGKNRRIRCEPADSLASFLFENKDNAGVTPHILSYFGEKRGMGDIRHYNKEELDKLGVKLGAF